MPFVIKWKEDGKTHEKSYDSKAGMNYRRKAIAKKLGEDAIISEVQSIESQTTTGKGQKKTNKTVEISIGKSQREPMRGPVDPALAILGSGENDRPVSLVESNWNFNTNTYTSRMYGADFGRSVRVIEPDGTVSLYGDRKKIIKHVVKGTYHQVLSDGRVFDALGWAVAPTEELVQEFTKKKKKNAK